MVHLFLSISNKTKKKLSFVFKKQGLRQDSEAATINNHTIGTVIANFP